MFPLSFPLGDIKSILNESSKATGNTHDSDARAVEELKSRVAVRFFLKKSKRFGSVNYSKQHEMRDNTSQVNLQTEPSPECLQYLGLAPKGAKACERTNERKKETRQQDDFLFMKPRIYECDHCPKLFFHKLLYRRHMIRHFKRIHWCLKCNRGFITKIAKRRHQLSCRR